MSRVILDLLLHYMLVSDILQDIMEGVNRIVALFVGLLAVLLFIGFLLGRFNKNNKSTKFSGALGSIFNSKTATKPTSTPYPSPTKIAMQGTTTFTYPNSITNRQTNTTTNTTSIPETGSETLLLGTFLITLGVYIKKSLNI